MSPTKQHGAHGDRRHDVDADDLDGSERCRQCWRPQQLYGFNVASNRDLRYYWGAYFQDDWKVTSTFTLNLGLRWDHFTPYADIDGRQANFVQSDGGNGNTGTFYIPNQGCTVPRAPAFDSLMAASNITIACTSNKATGNAQTLNFAPRIGFADRITPLLVVRAGFGIAYGALANIRVWREYWQQLPVCVCQFLEQHQWPVTVSYSRGYPSGV